MTNRDMVKDAARQGRGSGTQPLVPETELAPPVPAPEGAAEVVTRREPLDSPQPKPMIDQSKSGGLNAPGDDDAASRADKS